MPQTTSNLSNSLRTQYIETYQGAADFEKLYDQFATPAGKDMAMLEEGSSVQVPFLSDMTPGTTVISQTTDVTPQQLRDAVATITLTSRGEALQWSQLLNIQTYTDYADKRIKAIGKNMQESVELLALAAALQGGNVFRAVARASLDAGTAGHRLTDLIISELESRLMTLKSPPFLMGGGDRKWAMLGHPAVFHDLRQAANVLAVGQYQQGRIILNFELGEIGSFKIVQSPWAKVFGAAGADNGSVAATTIAAAVTAGDNNALAKFIEVASATNITAGKWLTIGTEETANTFQPTNERVLVSADYVSGTRIDIIGESANGGLRFDHAVGAAVRNADSVYPVVFGGPMSIAKVYATEVGEYGEFVEPNTQGLLNQFTSAGWKFYGGYGRWSESYILRGEFASVLDA